MDTHTSAGKGYCIAGFFKGENFHELLKSPVEKQEF